MTIVRNCQYQTYNFHYRSTNINHYILLQQWLACSIEQLGRPTLIQLYISLLTSGNYI